MVTGHIKEWDNVEENGNWVELLEGWFVRVTPHWLKLWVKKKAFFFSSPMVLVCVVDFTWQAHMNEQERSLFIVASFILSNKYYIKIK